MSQKNETTTLVAAFLITAGLLGGGIWFLSQQANLNLGNLFPTGKQESESASESNNAVQQPNRPQYDTFAQVQAVPSGSFGYGGSTTWAPIRGAVDPAIQTVWPSFNLRYTSPTAGSPGSSTGIRMLLDGQVAFSQSSRPLKSQEYEQAEQRGFALREIPVALEGIAIAVHPDLSLPGITFNQLKDIYTGNITNWSQVGGPNLPITAYSRRIEAGGTVEFFVENVLANGQFGSAVKFLPTTTQALRAVSNDPGGLYYASAPEVVPQCTVKSLPLGKTAGAFIPPYQPPMVPLSQCPGQRNQLNNPAFRSGEYPITRSLFVIVKANGAAEQKAGEAYADLLLSQQGQDLIVKAGFVKIR